MQNYRISHDTVDARRSTIEEWGTGSVREGPARRWITITDDDIDKSSAPRGGGSVGRGALNLLPRGFILPQTADTT